MFIAIELKTRLVTVRKHNEIMKVLNFDTMETIRDEFWPKHFQNVPETYPGAGGYRYEKRSKKYEDRKFRKYGHRRPLVWSGKLERAVKETARISGTSRGARLTARHPHPMQKERFQEMNAVSNREQRELAKRYGRNYARLCALPENQEYRLRKPAAIS